MTDKELFDIHQEILSRYLERTPLDEKYQKKINDFILTANTKIDAYCQAIHAFSYEFKKFTKLADEVCSMRDVVQHEKAKRDAERGF